METEFWITQLGRLYQEADSLAGGTRGAAPLAEQFNEVLENLKKEFPDNDFVQSTKEADPPRGHSASAMQRRPDVAPEVRTKCAQLADAIGYDLPEEELRQQDTAMNVIRVEQEQTADQTVQQIVSAESTMEMINHLSRDPETTDELRDLVERFEDELSSEEPDESRLREFIGNARSKSPEVAANLGMLALQKGLIGILGL